MASYDVNNGVKKIKVKIAIAVSMVMATSGFGMAVVVPAISHAASQPSACGAVHGAFANVNGNFGWLGPLGGTPGYHGAVGQEPGATGYNNSQGC